jgi:hypothetical protein
MKNIGNILINLTGRGHLEDLDVDGDVDWIHLAQNRDE